MTTKPVKVGIVGLGLAGADILTSLGSSPDVEVCAAADVRADALDAFRRHGGGRTYESASELFGAPDIEAVWLATPTHLHCEHAVQAAVRGKHIVVEKPLAVTLAEADRMIDAAQRNRVVLIAGGVRSFDPAILAMRDVIASGRLGELEALTALSNTGWMTRPRESFELDEGLGGGVLYNQAPHMLDVLRLLGGGMIRSVRGITRSWMAERPCPGYFAAYLEFDDGTPATLSYNGYGYVHSWEFLPWGETPTRRQAAHAGQAYRQALRSGTADERAAREMFRYSSKTHELFAAQPSDIGWAPADAGIVIASCTRGEVRQSAAGLFVYDDSGRHDEPLLSRRNARHNEAAELRAAIETGEAPLHDGLWGRATLEACLALAVSGVKRCEVRLQHQVSAERRTSLTPGSTQQAPQSGRSGAGVIPEFVRSPNHPPGRVSR